ncbi:hypothetical protein P9597_29640 [Aneurinibacillus migulanus]|uniref:hypothetical protein n=1 Tax=Aneurinibacillus migulanus TaxID=47500 RepID=UPI002E2310D0|nr:hypothetical protein [Aneurinibacillus migulanus]
MTQGLRFINEYPKFKSLFEKIFIKRELDDWYRYRCKEPIEFLHDLKHITHIIEIDIRNHYFPSVDVFLKLQNVNGEGRFLLEQEVHLQISKIIPVYLINYGYSIKHSSIIGSLDLWGPPQTFELFEVNAEIENIFASRKFIKLHEKFDAQDTIYNWTDLPNVESVNRSLTLEYAAFYDVLGLCE